MPYRINPFTNNFDYFSSSGGGAGTDLSYDATTRLLSSSTGADVTLPLMDSSSAGLVPASGGGTTNFLRADGTFAAPPSGSSFTGGTLTSNLTLAAGTTSLSPLTLQSGTNLTTATAGAVEYDGKVIYSTPAGRGVSPSMMFYRLDSALAGSNVNTAQNVFGVGATLVAGTVYAFDGFFTLQKTAGITSHTISLLFGGTASLNNIGYWAAAARFDTANASGSSSTNLNGFSTVAAAVVYSASIASASETLAVKIQGTVSINAGGTFIPQYKCSNAPGGAYSTLAGSSFAIWPIGASGANTSVGPWA